MKVFSGIQPTGSITLGNFSVLSFWKDLQDREINGTWMIADLHALSLTNRPPEREIENIYLFLLALGLRKENIILQSAVPEHLVLFWKLHSLVGRGELDRMPQWKDKKKANGSRMGLFSYPILMAADIILNNPTHVPVGKDQLQHLDFTRDLVTRLNSRGCSLNLPQPIFRESEPPKIKDLKNPQKKMSKSGPPKGQIFFSDYSEEIKAKIIGATTDSLGEVKMGNSEGMDNLFWILQLFENKNPAEISSEHTDGDYYRFKNRVADVVVDGIQGIQKEMKAIQSGTNWKESLLRSSQDYRSKINIPEWED